MESRGSKTPGIKVPLIVFTKDQVALSCPWCSYLRRSLWRESAVVGASLIDYQEAGTGIWDSSVHYSYRAHLPVTRDGGVLEACLDLSRY